MVLIPALLGLGAVVPDVARAQGTRPDSVARADSIARADSALLQGELARIRGERRRVDSRTVDRSAVQARTPLRSPMLRAGVMIGAGTAWAEDDAGVTVRQGLAGGASAGLAWLVGGGYGLALELRGTFGSVAIDDGGESRSGGSTSQVDLTTSLEHALGGGFGIRVGGGGAMVWGPDDVVPFRYGNNGKLQPTAEVGLLHRLIGSRPLSATLTVQTTRFGGATLADPVAEPGWVTRGLVGVRYGR